MNIYTERLERNNEISDYSKANWGELRRDLSKINWDRELFNLDANQAWDKFKKILDFHCNKHIPKKKVRTINRPLWMTRNAIRVIRKD